MNETILAACIEISSQPIFSLRTTSGSAEYEVEGSIGAPVGPNPNICSGKVSFSTGCHSETMPYLHAYTGRTSALNLVFMSEKANPSSSPAIIQCT